MGSDDLHHKRKAAQKQDLKRHANLRAPYDRVLIVCEDEKSAPLYLEALCASLKLNTVQNVTIIGDTGSSDPQSIVEYAIDVYKNGRKAKKKQPKIHPKSFEKIYCVIDRDKHDTYYQALDIAQGTNLPINNEEKKPEIKVIVSEPCFEYWLLLHFKYVDTPFYSPDSNCELAKKALLDVLPFYDKGKNFRNNICNHQSEFKALFSSDNKIFELCCNTNSKNEKPCYKAIFNAVFKPKLDDAITNAKKVLSEHEKNSSTDTNPSTQMYKLVEYLRDLKKA